MKYTQKTMQTSDLPYSQACENNKAPILAVLKSAFSGRQRVLEIGSGTGQHAVHFAEHLPHLTWQASDQVVYLADLDERIRRSGLHNLPKAVRLDICNDPAPQAASDAVFTANTLHIMSWLMVERFFSRLPELTQDHASLCIYGPFNYGGQFTSASNHAFDLSLKSRDPAMGIRDVEKIIELAGAQGFDLHQDLTMPANNRLLWFEKLAQAS